MSTGTCSIHSWEDGAADDDSDKFAKRVNHRLDADPTYYNLTTDGRSRRAGLRSRAVVRVDSDDEPDTW